MEKREWLLLAIHDTMEPIQIQKTLFKFSMESGAPERELYSFVPYNWGPLSLEIYNDLAALREQGSIEFTPSGRGWNVYHLTTSGKEQENNLREKANTDLLAKLDKMRSYVVSRNFETLLEDIYSDYPDYAAMSLFRKD
ncbi:hypothetical protein ACFLWY_04820 [Chloroflexota bacterium]